MFLEKSLINFAIVSRKMQMMYMAEAP